MSRQGTPIPVLIAMIAVYWLLRLLAVVALVTIGAGTGLAVVLAFLHMSPGSFSDLRTWYR
jgi:hypothetical protein